MGVDMNAALDKINVALDDILKVIGDRLAQSKGPEYLLDRLIRRGDFDGFKAFFDKYEPGGWWWSSFDIRAHESLFGPRWMSRFERPHLQWIYQLLVLHDTGLKYTAKLVADHRIAADRRAWCFHAVFSARTQPPTSPAFLLLPRFWWYNRNSWQVCLDKLGAGDENAFIRRLGLASKNGDFPETMWKSAFDDSVARFEIERELANRKISDSLLRFLIERNAAKCFVYMLANHGSRVFKLRSPEEWLLTVCRCAEEELAVAAVAELERQFPGIVGRTRDPWGNTALWNILCGFRRKPLLQDELVRFGCDPDAENDLGLSFRLLRENTPARMRTAGVPHP